MEIKKPVSDNPIPSHAKKVFKGQIFNVYQWEQQGYDGKIHIFEKLKRSDTALIIPVTEDGKIIIARQEQPGVKPFAGLVGGRLDEGEEPLEAAKRELMEETGYEAKEWLLFDSSQPVSKIDWAVYLFIAKGCKKVTEQNLDGAEKVEMLFINFNEFIEITLGDESRDEWLKIKLLEARLDPVKMEALKKQLGV
ncbi:MAG: NUDIX hydrolase [bacterium]|nr:NUDIX hydrolase [bacterium]